MDKQNVTPVWIWSDEHQGYWKPDGCGYTAAAVNAGVWSQQDAESITRHCGPEKKIRLIPLPDDFRLAQARLLCPSGYAVVPVEPTEAMLNAARDWSVRVNGQGVGNDQAAGCYGSMIASATEGK